MVPRDTVRCATATRRGDGGGGRESRAESGHTFEHIFALAVENTCARL